jgi:hypothetical protein
MQLVKSLSLMGELIYLSLDVLEKAVQWLGNSQYHLQALLVCLPWVVAQITLPVIKVQP